MDLTGNNANTLTISSFNCQGLGNHQKRRDIFHFLRKKQHSIYCIQDTHFEKKMEQYIKAEWGYECFFSSYRSNARGVAILFNNNFEFKVNKVESDSQGNFIIISFTTNDKELLLVSIYGPNKDDPAFYEELSNRIKNYGNNNVILVGDFNMVLEQEIDCFNYKHINNPKAKKVVEDMMQDIPLTDVWRESNPESRRYTWRRPTPLQQSRLDFFLMSDYLYWYYKDSDILPGYRSDHSIITLELEFSKEVKRQTLWKFNSSLLREKEYLDEINNLITEITEEYTYKDENNGISSRNNQDKKQISSSDPNLTVSDRVFLDFLLMKIREKTIQYATNKKKESQSKEHNLMQIIKDMESKEVKSEEDLKIIEENKRELESIREKSYEWGITWIKSKMDC